MIKCGSVLLGDSGQVFRILGEDKKKLWPGSSEETELYRAIGIVEGLPKEVIILKKEIKHFKDITQELSIINESFQALGGIPDDPIMKVELENRTLRIDIDKLRSEFHKLQDNLKKAQETISEKDSIIQQFEGSAEDIRKAADGCGVEDIRNAVYGRDAANAE